MVLCLLLTWGSVSCLNLSSGGCWNSWATHQESPGGEFALTGHRHSSGTECITPRAVSTQQPPKKKADFPALTRFEKNNCNTGYDPQLSGEENLGQIQRWACEWQMWRIVLLQLVHNMAQAGKQETEI